MKKMMRIVAMVALAELTVSIALAAAPAGGGRGGRGGGGRGNTGDTAPSNSPTAKSLVRAATPTTQPSSQGFIQRWAILEPLPGGPSTQVAFTATAHKEYFPNQMTVIPKDGEKVTVDGKELAWHVLDTKNFNVNLVHFANDLGISSASSLFWVVTVIDCPEDMSEVRLAIGSNDASVWWVNDKEVVNIFGDRQSVVDDGVSRRISLKKGPNVIRGAMHNGSGQTDFCARILDKDGNPVTNFTVNLQANTK